MTGDWHLDKKFGIMVIFSMIIQAGSIVWYASEAESRLTVVEARPDLTERVIHLEALTGEHGRIFPVLNDTLNRLNTTVTNIALEQAKRTPAIEKVYELDKQVKRIPH